MVLATSFFGTVVPAHAQPAAGTDAESEREAARASFERGRDAFEVGDRETAADAFLDAYQATSDPDLLYNVYSAQERGGRLAEAREALAGYLERSSVSGEERTDLQARLARLDVGRHLLHDEALSRASA